MLLASIMFLDSYSRPPRRFRGLSFEGETRAYSGELSAPTPMFKPMYAGNIEPLLNGEVDFDMHNYDNAASK